MLDSIPKMYFLFLCFCFCFFFFFFFLLLYSRPHKLRQIIKIASVASLSNKEDRKKKHKFFYRFSLFFFFLTINRFCYAKIIRNAWKIFRQWFLFMQFILNDFYSWTGFKRPYGYSYGYGYGCGYGYPSVLCRDNKNNFIALKKKKKKFIKIKN